ncbi:MAG: PilZ domain-containing protein [Planctomycetota bacterium]|nr:PilZ domain-containing protein [Planctomycetota bacterium]
MENSEAAASLAFQAIMGELAADSSNRRDADRAPWRSGVELYPLDADLQVIGEMARVYVSDISRSGMGVVSDRPIDHQYVKLTVPGAEFSLFGRVIHVTSIDESENQFLVGVKFLK